MPSTAMFTIDGADYADCSEESLKAADAAIEDDFALFDDWMERYQYLIDLGKELPSMSEQRRTDEKKIAGCQSQVWIDHAWQGDRLYLHANSDALIVSGLIALLLRLYSGRKGEEIQSWQPQFIKALGLDSHLSPTRNNGLVAMLKHIQATAAQGPEA
jgi:cysteine desulfuration protein SufE